MIEFNELKYIRAADEHKMYIYIYSKIKNNYLNFLRYITYILFIIYFSYTYVCISKFQYQIEKNLGMHYISYSMVYDIQVTINF